MKRLKSMKLAFAFFAIAGLACVLNAETIKKLHSSPQLIINATSMHSTNESDSSIVDLSGGDLDKCSFQLNISSGSGASPTFDATIYVSPDGGNNWASAGTFTQITTTLTAVAQLKTNVATSPGTKLKVTPLITGATFYTIKLWAVPSVD